MHTCARAHTHTLTHSLTHTRAHTRNVRNVTGKEYSNWDERGRESKKTESETGFCGRLLLVGVPL